MTGVNESFLLDFPFITDVWELGAGCAGVLVALCAYVEEVIRRTLIAGVDISFPRFPFHCRCVGGVGYAGV